MDRIKLHDKWFKPFISNEEIESAIVKLSERLNSDYRDKERPLFLSVLNGSFMFAGSLLQHIQFDCEISFIKLSSYSGTGSTGVINEILGLSRSVKGRNIIILEDIVDTGHTIVKLFDLLAEEGAADIKVCTLLYKPTAYKQSLSIDYPAISIPPDFIVGYGLDYDELGRQYKEIYVLDED